MIDLTKVIKRLELIKTLISLEEEDDITEQVSKLKELQSDPEVQVIIDLLRQKAFGKAVIAIEAFVSKHNQVSVYADPEIEALRFEAKTLEKQIQERSDEKAELDKLIHEFNVRHTQELGQLIIELLQYRKEQSKGTSEEKEAQQDYEEFYANYESEQKETIAQLTEEEEKELKAKYRKASKLCHPDIVEDDKKEEAHKIFVELNEAYKKNDLHTVNELLNSLQCGTIFTSKADTINKKQNLLTELERLRQKLNELNNTITNIKTSNTFITINNIKNWDDYFLQTKQQLEKQLSQLQNG